MKIFFLIKNNSIPKTADDIKVEDIYGIYQNREKSFLECKIANLKICDNINKKLLSTYIIKEIELETNEIITTYMIYDINFMIDLNTDIKFKLPICNLKEKFNNN